MVNLAAAVVAAVQCISMSTVTLSIRALNVCLFLFYAVLFLGERAIQTLLEDLRMIRRRLDVPASRINRSNE